MKTLIISILILIAAQAAAQTTEPTVEQRSNANGQRYVVVILRINN